ncbi:MAG: hypothetical protein LUH00_09075 [Lachnospiraceae bacterium]|nr:hypothetical protein [Lachnospiraceae bacterium]
MAASDILSAKPDGLISTEAAVAGIPLIHVSPIPGCETKNRAFFAGHGMSVKNHCDLEMIFEKKRTNQ